MIAALFFYLFAATCIASALMVIASRNPVHSVLFLILAFVNAAGLFLLLGAEFLALIGIVLLAEILLVVGAWTIGGGTPRVVTAPIPTDVSNTEAIGLVLYTK